MQRAAVILLLVACAVGRPASADQAKGSILGRVWERNGTLLVEVEADSGSFDAVRLDLAGSGRLSPGVRLPPGWRADDSRPFGVYGGPTSRVVVGFDLPAGARVPDKVRLEVLSAGDTVFKEKVEVVQSPPPRPVDDPGDLVYIPPLLSPGGEVMVGLAHGAGAETGFLPELVSGVHLTWRSDDDVETLSLTPTDPDKPWRGGFTGRVPADLPAAPQIDVLDAFGESLYTGSLEEQLMPATSWPQTPVLSGVSDKAVIGGTLCVSGYAPSLDDWANLRLGDQPLGLPLWASSNLAALRVPESLPGAYTVTSIGPGQFVRFESEPLETEVIEIQAGIREETIRTGQQTIVYFNVLGTEDPMAFDLELISEGVGQLEGGNRQTATTAGGEKNGFERQVVGLKPGEFNVNWGTDAGNCPGAEGPPSAEAPAGLDPALEKIYAEAFLQLFAEARAAKVEPPAGVSEDPEDPCTPTPRSLCLSDDRFRVEVDWTPTVPVGPAVALPLQGDTGFFFFSDPNHVEFLLKVLDGCRPNGRFWVFYAATTNVEFTLTVTDTQSGLEKSYFNPLGKPAPAIVDTQAFATCP